MHGFNVAGFKSCVYTDKCRQFSVPIVTCDNIKSGWHGIDPRREKKLFIISSSLDGSKGCGS